VQYGWVERSGGGENRSFGLLMSYLSCQGGNLIFQVLSILDVTFLNNFQVVLKGLKGRQEGMVTISQGFVLIDEGNGFILERFNGGRFAIMGRMRDVGDICLDRRRGIFFHLGIVRRGGASEWQGLNGGARGFPPLLPLPLCLLDIRG